MLHITVYGISAPPTHTLLRRAALNAERVVFYLNDTRSCTHRNSERRLTDASGLLIAIIDLDDIPVSEGHTHTFA